MLSGGGAHHLSLEDGILQRKSEQSACLPGCPVSLQGCALPPEPGANSTANLLKLVCIQEQKGNLS